MLSLKPRSVFRPKSKRLSTRKGMTIAIGTYFADGVILCADTKFVDDNGNISYGRKIEVLQASTSRIFAIAHAANDSNAAAMLSSDILYSLEHVTQFKDIEPSIKERMTRWLADYGQSSAPLLQFLVATVMHGVQSLYFCQPPNVVIERHRLEPIPIGSAVKVVEALMPLALFWPQDGDDPDPLVMDDESTLLKLAYLMRRAKKEDLYAGGETDTAVLYKDGKIGQTTRGEMKEAEEFSELLDRYLKYVCYGLFSQQSVEEQNAFMQRLTHLYLRDSEDVAKKMWFPSLQGLVP